MKLKQGQILNFRYYDNIYGKLIAWSNLVRTGDQGFTHSAIIHDGDEDAIAIAGALNKGFIVAGDGEFYYQISLGGIEPKMPHCSRRK